MVDRVRILYLNQEEICTVIGLFNVMITYQIVCNNRINTKSDKILKISII